MVTKKKFKLILSCLLALFYLLLSNSLAYGVEITSPEVKLQENEIRVTTALSLDDNLVQDLRKGIEKEFRFYVDIFRVWKTWPDEFVTGKLFVRTVKCDPVKKEFVATSNDGSTLIEKRFKSFESMVKWAVSINDLKLANTRELQPGAYFVRVTVASKIRNLPPVLDALLIFISENEFKIKRDSSHFSIGPVR